MYIITADGNLTFTKEKKISVVNTQDNFIAYKLTDIENLQKSLWEIIGNCGSDEEIKVYISSDEKSIDEYSRVVQSKFANSNISFYVRR